MKGHKQRNDQSWRLILDEFVAWLGYIYAWGLLTYAYIFLSSIGVSGFLFFYSRFTLYDVVYIMCGRL